MKGTSYFVGQVTEVNHEMPEILVKIFRKERAHFYFPTITDDGIVSKDSIKVLPVRKVRRVHYTFDKISQRLYL